MSKLTKQEKEEILNDLISYYRFCKADRRNHIFNAVHAIRNREKSEEDLLEAKDCLLRARESYSYYKRMKTVALLLKLNLIDFTTYEERIQAIDHIISHYNWKIKTKLFYIKSAEKRLKSQNKLPEGQILGIQECLQADKKQRDIYKEKLELVNQLSDEIII